MASTTVIFVEGFDDAVVISRLLEHMGFTELSGDDDWGALSFLEATRKRSNGELVRGTSPSVWESNDSLAGVQPVRGKSALAPDAVDILEGRFADEIESAGIFVDADGDPGDSFEKIRNSLATGLESYPGAQELSDPGQVVEGENLRLGVFVWPDNEKPGTVEDLLELAWKHARPELWARAAEFIRDDCEDLTKGWSREDQLKGTISVSGSPLIPGVSNAVLLRNDRGWLHADTLEDPEWAAVVSFLTALLE